MEEGRSLSIISSLGLGCSDTVDAAAPVLRKLFDGAFHSTAPLVLAGLCFDVGAVAAEEASGRGGKTSWTSSLGSLSWRGSIP